METFARKKPFVDIILPNYNKGKFLEEAINSVIAQTYKNWHLYIIDDNSSDNSSEIIDKLGNQKNITVVKLYKNKGPSFCRNYAMRISKSKYISFIDSDDTWESVKLEKQIDFMEKNNLYFTYTDYTPFFQINEKKTYKQKTRLKDTFDFNTFIKNSSINTTTMIIRRSILGTHRFKRIKLMEDYLFKCQLMKNNSNPALIRLLGKAIKNILLLIGVISALGTIGIDISAMVAGLGLTGFALGFALKDILSNLISGVLILLYEPFKLNDSIIQKLELDEIITIKTDQDFGNAEHYQVYGIVDADVNVVHNIQKYRLKSNDTLNRKFCTLEKSGPQLLKCLSKKNFSVNYTVVPYTGVSMIDFRFRLKKCPTLNQLIMTLENAIYEGQLKGLYNMHDADRGPEVHNCTPFSAVFIKENLKIVKDQVYIFSYFDNENSVNRYYDLANYIAHA